MSAIGNLMGLGMAPALASQITSNAGMPQQVYNTASNTSGFTATGAQASGGTEEVFFNITGTLAAGASVQLPTVANLIAAMQSAGLNPQPGTSYILNVMNTSGGAFAWTVTTNTGWTLTGTMTAAQNTLRKLLVKFTSLTAVSAQSLGEYAITGGI